MGFKKFKEFNIALLGKQAWRIHTMHTLLVSKIFKARYFPRGSFLNATIGNNPSYVWISILSTQDMLKRGSLCAIEDGRNTKIFHDPWVLDQTQPRPATFIDESLSDAKVCDLMKPDVQE